MRKKHLHYFGKKLKELREKDTRYSSKASLAEAADIHQSYITNIEKFRCLPGVRVVSKIAKVLGSKDIINEYIKTREEELSTEISYLTNTGKR